MRRGQARRGRGAGNGICPRELDERGGAGGIVVRSRSRPVVIAVRHDEDRLRRSPRHPRDEILEVEAPKSGCDGGERLDPRLQAVRRKLVVQPRGCLDRAHRAGESVRVADAQVVGQRRRRRRVERRRKLRRGQRLWSRDAERQDEERQADDQPRAAIEPAVDGPLERAGSRPAPLWTGRNGGHAWL